VILLVALATCGRGPAPVSPGSTQATAIPLPLERDASATQPGTLTGVLAPRASARELPRWYSVTLRETRTLAVALAYRGAAQSVAIELLDPAGQPLAHANEAGETYDAPGATGWRSAWLDEAQGTYYVRVTARDGAETYGLKISSTEIAPRPPAPVPCNPFVLDAGNPRCAGIVACDPNQPVATNPACCTVLCIRGACTGTLSPADDGFAWFDLGAAHGITRWYRGDAELPRAGGTRSRGNITVVEVERTRSKVLLTGPVDRERLAGTVARLERLAGCK
jgi:hypothetical protein